MTVSYQYEVASSTSGGFTRLLFMWRGSLYKLIYREFLLFIATFGILSALYRHAFTENQKRIMHSIALYIDGNDDHGRMIRRTLMRYLNVTLILVLRSISSAVKRRFPTLEHLVESGFMTAVEIQMYQSVPSVEFNTYWIPCTWFISLLKETRKESRITDSQGLKIIMEEFNEFRSKCGLLWSYDWVSIPLVYTQVVTIVTYSFFIAALFGRQYVDSSEKPIQMEIDIYIPIFTTLQFFFFMGLLKVAEQLINPFGDDDEDFELNWLIDRHTKVSYLGVDTLMTRYPPLVKDMYFNDADLTLPYTEAAVTYKKKTYRGSVHNMQVPENKHTMFLPEIMEDDEEKYATPKNSLQNVNLSPPKLASGMWCTMCWKCFDCFRAQVEDVQLLDYQHCMLNDVPVEVFTYERTLEELYLQSNRIRDLPRPLFHCHGLKTLSLSDNDILNLPPAIASLINLRRLDLSKNALCGIPDNIKCCKQLFWIDVSVNPLEKLPEGFTQLINLEELYLNDTYLDFLPANFGRLTKLKILELRENNLNTLPKSIARLSHLERLDIGQNEFSDLPEIIGSLINLTELWIDCNRIRSIPAFIGNLKKLIHFDATNNSIDWIAPEIEKCKKMVDFTVSYNELQTIPSTIGHLEELITLKLDDNQLNLLPNTIGKLSKLEEMILSQNDLEALPKSIGLLRKLRVLNVDDNMLEELPPEIGSCSNLTIISVRNNKLQEVPAELGHLPSIRMINLSENLLCNLPVSILKLSHLTALWLSNNQNTPLVTLHKEIDKETRQTVCVNFMLPQTIQDRYVALPKGTANNSNEEHTPRSHPHIWFATETTEDKSCGLLRAPTPYPKELRAMSKHVRNMQQSSKRASREVDEVVPLLGELVSPESSDVQIKEAKVKKPTNITFSKNSITWQNNATASSRPSENSSVHASGDRPIIREAKFVRHINSASSLQHAEKVNLIEPTSLQSQLLLVESEYFKNQRLNIEPKTEQPLQPPPYHIAAAYSKQAIWFEHPPNCAKDSKLLRVPSSSESLHKAYVVGESK